MTPSTGKRIVKIKNYVPHNAVVHRDTTNGEGWDDYLENLSKSVGKACDKWLEAKGLKNNFKTDFSFGSMKRREQNSSTK